MAEAKDVNGSYISDLRSHVIAKRGNKNEESAGRNRSPGCCIQSFNRKILSGETFCFPGKRLL